MSKANQSNARPKRRFSASEAIVATVLALALLQLARQNSLEPKNNPLHFVGLRPQLVPQATELGGASLREFRQNFSEEALRYIEFVDDPSSEARRLNSWVGDLTKLQLTELYFIAAAPAQPIWERRAALVFLGMREDSELSVSLLFSYLLTQQGKLADRREARLWREGLRGLMARRLGARESAQLKIWQNFYGNQSLGRDLAVVIASQRTNRTLFDRK